jgi:integrase
VRARYRLLVVTALYTGMRISELLALTWADVDFAAGVVHVRGQLSRAQHGVPAQRVQPKTAAAIRDIPLVPQLAALLRDQRQSARFADAGDFVFATGNGTPLGHRNVEGRALQSAAAAAGLEAVRFHDLRHTFASHLIVDLGLGQPHPRPRQRHHHAQHLHAPLRRRPPRHRDPDAQWPRARSRGCSNRTTGTPTRSSSSPAADAPPQRAADGPPSGTALDRHLTTRRGARRSPTWAR